MSYSRDTRPLRYNQMISAVTLQALTVDQLGGGAERERAKKSREKLRDGGTAGRRLGSSLRGSWSKVWSLRTEELRGRCQGAGSERDSLCLSHVLICPDAPVSFRWLLVEKSASEKQKGHTKLSLQLED
ncbi:hypothetical protein MHYP_G00090690 [Metynnis hypsauchen]